MRKEENKGNDEMKGKIIKGTWRKSNESERKQWTLGKGMEGKGRKMGGKRS